MSVVSNTTPLNYLILIGRVDILPTLYESVVIPEAVFGELTSESAPHSAREWILSKPDRLSIRTTPATTDEDLALIQIGERQAIVLAQQVQSEFIILDDRQARRVAADRGLKVIGTLGVLTTAAERGLIILRTALEDLAKTNFQASSSLLESLSDRDR
jgi:predicted nucleic acid-binding protein